MPDQLADSALHLQHGKFLADAVPRARREGCVGEGIDLALILEAEALRFEFEWLWEEIRITLGVIDEDKNVSIAGNELAICWKETYFFRSC